MNNYKEYGKKYVEKGYSCIPDKHMSKMPAIKSWSDYCYKMPTEAEIKSWSNIGDTGIAVCLGEASGIIALDIDTDKPELLKIIEGILPSSPVEKRGSKGFTRFYRYKGESTSNIKFDGSIILEVLSNGKKSTLPPSTHPNGNSYVWTSDKTLLDIRPEDLPLFPPFLIPHLTSKLQQAFPEAQQDSFGKVISGRNNILSNYLGKLMREPHSINELLRQLIAHDKEVNEVPLFSDANEMRHTDPVTNALLFYTNHLNSINTKRYRDKKEYLIPHIEVAINMEQYKELTGKKSLKQVAPKSANNALPPAHIVKMISTYFTKEQVKTLK